MWELYGLIKFREPLSVWGLSVTHFNQQKVYVTDQTWFRWELFRYREGNTTNFGWFF